MTKKNVPFFLVIFIFSELLFFWLRKGFIFHIFSTFSGNIYLNEQD